MSGLAVRNLVKRLGGNLVVDDVSFEIGEGEFFVLLGPSGGGKSTILRLISGLETPDSGQVMIAGRDVTGLPSRQRNVGMVFQDYGLYPNMNVGQNISYGLEARGGLPKKEIEQRVAQAAGLLGLGEMLPRSIVDLSGGEQQRVALARVMVKDSDAYLFDEPLANLDPKLRYLARRDILSLHRQKRKPSLYVTHDQSEAIAMADRIGIMARSHLQQVGTADDLLHEPANLFVAGFMGTPPMNLVPAAIERTGGTVRVRTDGLSVALPEPWARAVERQSPDSVVLGIRPDGLMPGATPGDENVVTGKARNVEPLIGETVVNLRLGNGPSVSAVIDDFGHDPIYPGDVLHLAINPERIRLFDPETEQVLTR